MKPKLTPGLCGVAGEYAVASELSRQGYLASITLRNTRGIDILAVNENATKSAAIQVKTNQSYRKSWLLTKKAEDIFSDHFFYIFVNLDTPSRYPEFHIVPSKVVARYITADHRAWLKAPGKQGQAHNDSPMRKFSDEKNEYLNRWNLLGLD